MSAILTVGELLIDLTQTHIDEGGVRHYAANPGGAPANVAVAAARLGASAGFIGKVGTDTYGDDLQAVLERSGVEVSGLYRTDKALTTQAVVSVAPSGERSFAFYRSPGADTLLTEQEVCRALAPLPRVVHFGSVSLTAEPARSATLAAGRLAKQGGALVSYDPNYRANLWPDEKTAVEWMKKPLPMVDLLKLSDEELPLLTGLEDPETGTAALQDCGIRLIVVTLGAKGVFYRLGDATGTIPGIQVKVADTNGAGDTFLGALLSRLVLRGTDPLEGLTGPELEEMLSFANRAAALTCTRSGAIPAMPTLAEVERFEIDNL